MTIRKLRLNRGWSQEQLAEISGVSTRTIQRIERGKKASLETLKCLAAVFETEPDKLQQDTDMPAQTTDNTPLSSEDRAALNRLRKWVKQEKDWGDEIHSRHKIVFYNLGAYLVTMVILMIINLLTLPSYLWFLWAALGWGAKCTRPWSYRIRDLEHFWF
jgi:transcriptional regulator with XRE-family HTH domain